MLRLAPAFRNGLADREVPGVPADAGAAAERVAAAADQAGGRHRRPHAAWCAAQQVSTPQLTWLCQAHQSKCKIVDLECTLSCFQSALMGYGPSKQMSAGHGHVIRHRTDSLNTARVSLVILCIWVQAAIATRRKLMPTVPLPPLLVRVPAALPRLCNTSEPRSLRLLLPH